MGEATIFVAMLFGAGILFFALGMPLFRQRVRPNFWYGCRTTKTLNDERTWYAVNRVTGKSMMIGGAMMIGASIVMFGLRNQLAPEYAAIIALVLPMLSSAFLVVESLRTQRRF